jgi:hypothetical protein
MILFFINRSGRMSKYSWKDTEECSFQGPDQSDHGGMVIFFGEFDPRVVEDLKRMKTVLSVQLREAPVWRGQCEDEGAVRITLKLLQGWGYCCQLKVELVSMAVISSLLGESVV